MIYKKPVQIQKLNLETDTWEDKYTVHANVNTSKRQIRGEFQQAGSVNARRSLSFWMRYSRQLEDINLNTQIYRILYRGNAYNIVEYDDYMEMHKEIRLTAEAVE